MAQTMMDRVQAENGGCDGHVLAGMNWLAFNYKLFASALDLVALFVARYVRSFS